MIAAETVYLLATLMSAACALLLLRGYLRSGTRLLIWSSFCFWGLCLNNALLFTDLIVLPNTDLSVARIVPAVIGVALLCYGLITEEGV